MTHAKEATHAPDVLIANAVTLFLFSPLSSRAKQWIDEHVEPDATWYGNTLVVEHSFAWGLGQGMKDAGLELK